MVDPTRLVLRDEVPQNQAPELVAKLQLPRARSVDFQRLQQGFAPIDLEGGLRAKPSSIRARDAELATDCDAARGRDRNLVGMPPTVGMMVPTVAMPPTVGMMLLTVTMPPTVGMLSPAGMPL